MPTTYLSEVVVEILGLKKVPNYNFEPNWAEPLADLLDQADGNIDHVEAALRTAATEGDGLTLTTPKSLYNFALKALAQSNGHKAPTTYAGGKLLSENDPAFQAWQKTQEGA